MKIGVDIDEVLVEFLESFLKFYNSKYNQEFKREDFHCYEFEEILGGSHENAIELIKEHGYNGDFNLVEGALDSIKRLSEKHELIVLTARHPMFKEKTEDFLEKNFGNIFSKILYTGEAFQRYGLTKSDLCKQLNIDLIIEDNLVFSKECAEKGIKVFLMDRPWNKNCADSEKIKRVSSWREIFDKIENLEVKKEDGAYD